MEREQRKEEEKKSAKGSFLHTNAATAAGALVCVLILYG